MESKKCQPSSTLGGLIRLRSPKTRLSPEMQTLNGTYRNCDVGAAATDARAERPGRDE